ncbi:hypothetical protein RDI58_002107 [Solanum bulbocastanum]|uniref:Uncharacterized protein n=1 Tax=Solanum bulbocastanum TaxID=147425 RepID=A0AAN8U920_SOLBU
MVVACEENTSRD